LSHMLMFFIVLCLSVLLLFLGIGTIKIYPTKNKAAYSRIILFIKKCVFKCIMAIYDKKDSVNTCKTSFTRVCTCKHWKNEKTQVVTPYL